MLIICILFMHILLQLHYVEVSAYLPLERSSTICFSYGPCQTPTLGFCVQRYIQITTFKPEKFWYFSPYIIKDGYELQLEWDRNRLFDFDVSFFQ